jgi:NET1-associated nuclear protein 1 (U3 small nucleolar RNA-associated protein 17)
MYSVREVIHTHSLTDSSYVFATNGREVQVLAVATSLVERTLAGPNSNVTAFTLSASDSETIYIASDRRVQCWEWVTGAIVNDPIEYKGKIHALCAALSDNASEDILYTICEDEAEWKILAGDRCIYTSSERLVHLSLDGPYIMAASATKLVAGRRTAPKPESDEEAHFTFVEIASPIEITCLGGRAQTFDAQKKKGPSDTLTVAAGNVEGQIMVYEDVFSTSRPTGVSLMPRILHWHREAVASLKWSQDGEHCNSSLPTSKY